MEILVYVMILKVYINSVTGMDSSIKIFEPPAKILPEMCFRQRQLMSKMGKDMILEREQILTICRSCCHLV